MVVAELIAPREFRFVDRPLPDLKPWEVRVRVQAVGICGSDLHSYSEGAIGDTPCEYPMVLGHEPAGVVTEVGAGVTGWSPGDRAALEPALYCYHCEPCLAGRHNICANIRFLSTPGHAGFFREYVDLPAGNLMGIPRFMPMDAATMIEPLAVALHSMQFAAMGIGETAVVFGAGPIGLLTAACLKQAGAGRIWAVEPVAHRREMARLMGADAALDPVAIDAARQIRADTGGRGVDCAIDCAARGQSTNQAIHCVRNGGRVVLTGIHSETMVPIETSPLRRQEVTLFSVRRSNHEPEAALHLLSHYAARFAPLITHTRPLEKIAEAFHITEHYADGVGKMIVA
jgi:L-iditol 2-dehydrogenase